MVLEKRNKQKKITRKKKQISSSLLIILISKSLYCKNEKKWRRMCKKKIIIGCAFWNLSVIYFFLFQRRKKKSEGIMGLMMLKTKRKIWFPFFGFKNVKKVNVWHPTPSLLKKNKIFLPWLLYTPHSSLPKKCPPPPPYMIYPLFCEL